ncbi:hypothetical protein CSQ96_01900 [Janthinobacterium sp. BJB412]|nr:hypothetical protein CSQ96_01900 [Janthinobacterium sp. BJB412]
MTMPIQFDTLQYAKRLEEAGIPSGLAEAQAQALSDLLADTIVVPGDLVLLKTDLIARVELLRHDTLARFELLKHELDAMEQRVNARLEALELRINGKLEALEQRINSKLEALEQRINGKFTTLHWVLGAMLLLHIATLAKLFSM